MARQKTTVYLDPDVATAVKVFAATRQQSSSDVIENAVLAYLASGDADAAREDLRSLMERLAERSQLTDEQAMAIAVDEARAARADRRRSA